MNSTRPSFQVGTPIRPGIEPSPGMSRRSFHAFLTGGRRGVLTVFFCTLPLFSFLPIAGALYRVGCALWDSIHTPGRELTKLAAMEAVWPQRWPGAGPEDPVDLMEWDGFPGCDGRARLYLSAAALSEYAALAHRLRQCGYGVGLWQDAREPATGWRSWVSLRQLTEINLRLAFASQGSIDEVLWVDGPGSLADVWVVEPDVFQRKAELPSVEARTHRLDDRRPLAWQHVEKRFLKFSDAMWPWILLIFHALLGTEACHGIAMLAFAKLRRKGVVKPMSDRDNWPSLSVLVPAYNEERVIVATVRSLVHSHYPGELEIIVIDDGSTDRTWAEAVGRFIDEPRVRVIQKANEGKASALNLGLAQAFGEIVVVIDADTVLHVAALQHLAANFVNADVAAVSGNMQVGNEANEWTRLQSSEYACANNIERRAQEYLGCITVVPGAIGAYRRSVLQSLGGYAQDTLAEDADLTVRILRAGWKIVFEERALARTEAPQNLSDFMRQRFRWSFGKLQVVWKHRAALFSSTAPRLGWIGLPMLMIFNFILPLFVLVIGWVRVMAIMVVCLQPTLAANLSSLVPVDLPVTVLIAELLAAGLFARLTRSVARSMDKKIPGSLARPRPWLRSMADSVRDIPVSRLMECVLIYLVYKSFVRMQSKRVTHWNKLQRMASVTADFDE